jgi:hypothetical protein
MVFKARVMIIQKQVCHETSTVRPAGEPGGGNRRCNEFSSRWIMFRIITYPYFRRWNCSLGKSFVFGKNESNEKVFREPT